MTIQALIEELESWPSEALVVASPDCIVIYDPETKEELWTLEVDDELTL